MSQCIVDTISSLAAVFFYYTVYLGVVNSINLIQLYTVYLGVVNSINLIQLSLLSYRLNPNITKLQCIRLRSVKINHISTNYTYLENIKGEFSFCKL